MTDEERREAAVNLVNAIKNNTNGAYDRWTGHTGLTSVEERATFVQETLGLSQTPTADDLLGIQEYATSALAPEIAQIQAKVAGANVVGELCTAEG
jgi:hypothetical protein